MFFYFPVRKRREEKRRLFLETQTNEMSECSVSLSLSLSFVVSFQTNSPYATVSAEFVD